jgi:rhodanese-related sulfurtransferase
MNIAELHPDLTMEELLQVLPGAQRALFRLYHIGGCSSCGFQPDETLRGVCERNDGLDPGDVLLAVRQEVEKEQALLIEPAELSEALQSDSPPVLLDVRTREEFEAVHIQGSTAFTQMLLQEMMTAWKKDRPIVVIDHHGIRALDAVAYFAGHGFPSIRALRGGIDAWSLEVDPSLPRYTVE